MVNLRRLVSMFGLGMVAVTTNVRAAESGFTATLSPAELASTGLDRLSDEERATLDALIARRYEATMAAAPSRRRQVEESPDTASVPREARISRTRGGEPDESAPRKITSRLEGTFTGWNGSTIFRLQNGQRWIQVDGTRYTAHPARENPEVEVVPAMMGTYFLKIDGVGTRCRVKLLDD